MKTVIKKHGNSRGFTIPASVLDELGWTEGTQVNLSVSNGALLVYPMAPSLEAMLATVPEGYREPEDDWGDDVGKEGAE